MDICIYSSLDGSEFEYIKEQNSWIISNGFFQIELIVHFFHPSSLVENKSQIEHLFLSYSTMLNSHISHP